MAKKASAKSVFKLRPERWSWGWIFVVLGVATVLTIILPWAVIIWATQRSQHGEMGMEYEILKVLPFIKLSFFAALANIFALLIYVVFKKPRPLEMATSVLIVLASGIYAAMFIYATSGRIFS